MADIGNFTIQYDNFLAPHKYVDHFHNAHEIIFVQEGEADFLIAGKKYNVKKNSIVFINSFESHKSTILKYPYKRYFILTDQKYLHSSINDPMLLSVFKQRPSLFEHSICLDDDNSQKVGMYLKRIFEEYNNVQKHSVDIIKSLFKLLVIDLYRTFPEYFPGFSAGESFHIIGKIENYIESNYKQDISLANTASLFNCDMYYLSHLFKKVTGYGFKEYLIYQRLSKAKELLLNTNHSINEICLLCGFKNINHYIRMFKQKEGITPLQYRKKYSQPQ